MDKMSLQAKARELAHQASEARSGRAADTVFGGHDKRLRQTVVALREGSTMAEHESPGEATILVISGRLWLVAGETRWFGRAWDYLVIPDERHSVEAETDTTFLLTASLTGR